VRVSASMAKVSGLVMVATAVGLFSTGCETGRTSKAHAAYDMISDETTTGKQDPSYIANGEGIPPVPGSPTAAGVDGKQPYNSGWARSSPGAEHGRAAPPAEQKKDRFIRQ
jgi:hypothetical protein